MDEIREWAFERIHNANGIVWTTGTYDEVVARLGPGYHCITSLAAGRDLPDLHPVREKRAS